MGTSNNGCQKIENNDFLLTCYEGAKFCGTEIIADWMPNGEQVISYQRRCRSTGEDNCVSGELTGMQFKAGILQQFWHNSI